MSSPWVVYTTDMCEQRFLDYGCDDDESYPLEDVFLMQHDDVDEDEDEDEEPDGNDDDDDEEEDDDDDDE
jgi:hypothetical protein